MTPKEKTKIEVAVLAVLLVSGASLWYFDSRPASGAPRATTSAANYRPMRVENPQIHWDHLEEAQSTPYKPSPRDIFNRDLPLPPPPPVHVPQPGDTDYIKPVVPPPPPPKLPLKYFGEGTVQSGSARRAFLSDGDAVYIVGEGDTILGRYRVVRIGRMSLEFEEIASGRRGTAKLEDQGPAL